MLALVGTYTRAGGGIHRVRLDPATGELRDEGIAAALPDPSFLALHPAGRFLYAVSEAEPGTVHAFALDRSTGDLRALGEQPSGGDAPCHLSVHPSGRALLVANYATGTGAALPIAADGSLHPPRSLVRHTGSGPDPERQQGPHAHCAVSSPDGRYAFLVDLGTDQVSAHRWQAGEAELRPAPGATLRAEPGSGPRHLAFVPDGRNAVLVAELASTVTALAYAADTGVFTPRAAVRTVPAGWSGVNTAAAVRVAADGRTVYASNRGHDSVAVLRFHGGALEPLQHQPSGGRGPRDLALDPAGRWMLVANEESGILATLAVDPETGLLSDTGHRLAVPAPVHVSFT